MNCVNWVDGGASQWPFIVNNNQLAVRSAYQTVWNRFVEVSGKRTWKQQVCGLLIKGHPGIGKTCLLNLLLSWGLHEYPTVPVLTIAARGFELFVNVGGNRPMRYVMKRGKGFDLDSDTLIKHGVKQGGKLTVLHDIKKGTSLPYQCGLIENL